MFHAERPEGYVAITSRGVWDDTINFQPHVLIRTAGAAQEQTLQIVARYGDACNLGGGFENVKRKDEILRRHCDEVGRDESEIERTVGVGTCVIRDDPAEARRIFEAMFAHNGNAKPWDNQAVGTAEQVAEKLRPFAEIGFRAHDRRLPIAVRRRVDGAPRHRGPADARRRVRPRMLPNR